MTITAALPIIVWECLKYVKGTWCYPLTYTSVMSVDKSEWEFSNLSHFIFLFSLVCVVIMSTDIRVMINDLENPHSKVLKPRELIL